MHRASIDRLSCRLWLPALIAPLICLLIQPGRAQTPAPTPAAAPAAAMSDADIEQFLLKARVVRTRSTGKGITGSTRATLTDGLLTHDAQIQTVRVHKPMARHGNVLEVDFRDDHIFNVAAYRLDRMIGLNMVPVSVARRWQTQPAAFTWWIDDVLMDEGTRVKKQVQPPQPAIWNESMQLVRVFDQLIYNIDRNLGNLLITRDWRVWAIDHTRAFRRHKELRNPQHVVRFDRQVFERLKQLDRDALKAELGEYLSDWELDGVLARRDLIVTLLENRGPAALFDRR